VLALAHVGLYLLLTASARADLRQIEARHAPRDLARASEPGPRPAEASGVRAWNAKQALWEDAREHEQKAGQVRLIGVALGCAWLAQVAIAAFLLRRAGR
jgi:hypothetical protein